MATKKPAPRPKPSAAGRPAGAANREYDEVEAAPTRCRQCGSTSRSAYFGRNTVVQTGEHEGRPYNRIVWRRCRCEACGQHRFDKSFELEPE